MVKQPKLLIIDGFRVDPCEYDRFYPIVHSWNDNPCARLVFITESNSPMEVFWRDLFGSASPFKRVNFEGFDAVNLYHLFDWVRRGVGAVTDEWLRTNDLLCAIAKNSRSWGQYKKVGVERAVGKEKVLCLFLRTNSCFACSTMNTNLSNSVW